MDIISRIFKALYEIARLARTLFTNGMHFIAYVRDPAPLWRLRIYSSENSSPFTKSVKSHRDASTTYHDLSWCYSLTVSRGRMLW